MKGKRGRPNIPLSNISNRKPSGLTASPAPGGDGDVQMDGKFARGGTTKTRGDKKPRVKRLKLASASKKANSKK